VVRGFHLLGSLYVPVLPDKDGRLPCSSLPLKVGVHDGWVRWFDLDGDLLSTRSEAADRRAEAAEQRAEAAEQTLKALEEELERRRR